ncbi:hypothetical protein CLV39_0277 [Hydrogenothermus marinus]|uniref:DUF4136 domain-containing protein n=2 Tax=Hydrogenothermus marinus TaxID=133270 RepID=A0A3M0BKK4_9AQUI|nr:hypothetical protein CLV39_0277 [Hydrogenothermus marinus]
MLNIIMVNKNLVKKGVIMKKSFFTILLIFFSFYLLSCSSVKENIKVGKLPKKGIIVVYPFENFSQTPYAGVKAASLTKGILLSKGFKVVDGYIFDGENIKLKSIKNFDYKLTGKVIEWRYKTGIDGEPAVSLYIQIKNKNGHLIWSATGSKSQWGHKSVSLTAQELIDELVSKSK